MCNLTSGRRLRQPGLLESLLAGPLLVTAPAKRWAFDMSTLAISHVYKVSSITLIPPPHFPTRTLGEYVWSFISEGKRVTPFPCPDLSPLPRPLSHIFSFPSPTSRTHVLWLKGSTGQPRWHSGLAPPAAQGVILETLD